MKTNPTLFAAMVCLFLTATFANSLNAEESPLDAAAFARVLSWGASATEGTKASRSDEFPAGDIAPYKEIFQAKDHSYAVPLADGSGDIGLQWDEGRMLRTVALQFAEAATVPELDSLRLQYWTGESEWQGKWEASASEPKKDGNQITWQFDEKAFPQGTQKVRWVFSKQKQPIRIEKISAFTQSPAMTADIRIERAKAGPATPADIEIYNGLFLDANGKTATKLHWDGAKPLVAKVKTNVTPSYKADRTVLRFKMSDGAFGVAVENLLDRDCVYVHHANVFVTREPSPISPEKYLEKIAGQNTMLETVRERPDQDFRRVWDVLHSPTQDRHNWVPTMISLACDNRKFLVHREGSIVFNEYNQADDYPGESDGLITTAANVNQWRYIPSFGAGQPLPVARHLKGGWLPIPVSTFTDKNVTYEQTTCVVPMGDAPKDKPLWFREKAICIVNYRVKNTGTEPVEGKISFKLSPERDPNVKVKYEDDRKQGATAASGERILAIFANDKNNAWSYKVDPSGIAISSTIPAGGEKSCMIRLPAFNPDDLEDAGYLLGEFNATELTEKYWKSLLEPAMQVDIPDELLSNIIRASQAHCMIAARNQQMSKYIVPWISSVHFAYPESEASSIIRGMSMAGQSDFAERGLDFYLKECNDAGYITILIHVKGTDIKVGYTIVGTGEILWALGEHYERTHDKEWMRKVAPDVSRICRWIIRQREKTKLLDAQGEKTPGYGLMPPGVSADWNRFAYRFFNEAQYWRGLQKAAEALADIGDPAAKEILADAKQYRQDIDRAYRAMQAKMPVVPLKNGTWIPADPSLVGCYGNVEEFMPGADAGRSYVYSVELGANHLAATETIDPKSKEALWMTDYLEDVQFLVRKQWYKDMSGVDPFDWGGFAKMQPYYGRTAEIYALRDDVKPFLRAYFNTIPPLLNAEDLTFWEDMGVGGYASGAWNKAHETGWFLAQTRRMFVDERADELWLAPFVTNAWLKDGQKIAVRNVPTRFGKVGYKIESKAAQGEIDAKVELSKSCTAKKIVLRLRHPDGKPIQSVTVQGKPHTDFDPQKETITLAPADGTIEVRAMY
jgi:hypothetical protein